MEATTAPKSCEYNENIIKFWNICTTTCEINLKVQFLMTSFCSSGLNMKWILKAVAAVDCEPVTALTNVTR